MAKSSRSSTAFAFAVIFLLIAVALISVAFSTNFWVETYVDREALEGMITTDVLNSDGIYYTRFRGLFRTCYPNDAAFVDLRDNIIDGSCLSETGFEVPTRNPDTIGYGDSYGIRIHLLRAEFASFVLALLFFFVCCITAILGCWNTNPATMRSTGVLCFVGMFFTAAAMALFHGVYYLEENILTNVPGTPAYIAEEATTNINLANLDSYTSSSFGYSYILGWVGMGFAAISGIVFLTVAYQYVLKNEEKFGKKKKKKRNPAYEFMDRPGAAYPPPSDDYYRSYATPYGASPYGPEPVPVIDDGYDYGGYRY